MRAQGIRGALDRHDHRCRAPWQRLPPHTPHAHFTRTLLYALLCNLCPQHTTSPRNPPFPQIPRSVPVAMNSSLVLSRLASPSPPSFLLKFLFAARFPVSPSPRNPRPLVLFPFHPALPLPPRHSFTLPSKTHTRTTALHPIIPPAPLIVGLHPPSLSPRSPPRPHSRLRFPPSPPTVFPPHSQARVGQL